MSASEVRCELFLHARDRMFMGLQLKLTSGKIHWSATWRFRKILYNSYWTTTLPTDRSISEYRTWYRVALLQLLSPCRNEHVRKMSVSFVASN